jgi:predicted transposase
VSEVSVKNNQTSLKQSRNTIHKINSKIIPKTLKKIQSSTLYKCEMKTTIKIQLETNEVGKKRLLDTMEVFNKVCNEIDETYFKQKSNSKFNIQKLVYHHIRKKYGLSAQQYEP